MSDQRKEGDLEQEDGEVGEVAPDQVEGVVDSDSHAC